MITHTDIETLAARIESDAPLSRVERIAIAEILRDYTGRQYGRPKLQLTEAEKAEREARRREQLREAQQRYRQSQPPREPKKRGRKPKNQAA